MYDSEFYKIKFLNKKPRFKGVFEKIKKNVGFVGKYRILQIQSANSNELRSLSKSYFVCVCVPIYFSQLVKRAFHSLSGSDGVPKRTAVLSSTPGWPSSAAPSYH